MLKLEVQPRLVTYFLWYVNETKGSQAGMAVREFFNVPSLVEFCKTKKRINKIYSVLLNSYSNCNFFLFIKVVPFFSVILAIKYVLPVSKTHENLSTLLRGSRIN